MPLREYRELEIFAAEALKKESREYISAEGPDGSPDVRVGGS
jgi:hypothetical protein